MNNMYKCVQRELVAGEESTRCMRGIGKIVLYRARCWELTVSFFSFLIRSLVRGAQNGIGSWSILTVFAFKGF